MTRSAAEGSCHGDHQLPTGNTKLFESGFAAVSPAAVPTVVVRVGGFSSV